MKYSMDFWNDCHYDNFDRITNRLKSYQRKVDILEIGTFEGKTSFWLLDNIPNCHLTVMDPEVHEPNFSNNFKEWAENNDASRFNWKRDYSFPSLLKEYTLEKKYDFIYIDGCHCAKCVLQDAILSWKILKNNGILLFDDYLLEVSDNWFYISHKEFETNKRDGCMWIHPKQAIDSFLSIYKGQYRIFIDNYQIGIEKICDTNNLNSNHEHKDIGKFREQGV